MLACEAKREQEIQMIYQSDNGRELKNKVMLEAMDNAGVLMRHSLPYNPRTNGKAENRVKVVSKAFFTQLKASGGLPQHKGGQLSNADLHRFRTSLKSATDTLNSKPGAISSFPPFKVRRTAEFVAWTECIVVPLVFCLRSKGSFGGLVKP